MLLGIPTSTKGLGTIFLCWEPSMLLGIPAFRRETTFSLLPSLMFILGRCCPAWLKGGHYTSLLQTVVNRWIHCVAAWENNRNLSIAIEL